MTIDDRRPVFDLPALDRRTGGDRSLVLDVVRMFLEDCPSRVAAIRAAVESGDAARVRAAAHSLKGAASYLSAVFVVEAAAHLEAVGREGRMADAADGLERLESAVAQLLPELRLMAEH